MLLGIMATDSGDGVGNIEESLWDSFGRNWKYLGRCLLSHCPFVEGNHKVYRNFSNYYNILYKEKTIMEWGLCPHVVKNSWVGWKRQ